MDLNQSIDNLNVAGELDEDLLAKLGEKVVKDFEEDEDSRSDWLERVEDWIKLATQVSQQWMQARTFSKTAVRAGVVKCPIRP